MKYDYKVSRYTFTVENDNKFYLYNSLSNVLLEVDKELFDIITQNKESGKIINAIAIPITESLYNAKILTRNDEDDFLLYKAIIQGYRSDNRRLLLTFAPTMDCCFNCHYCFEKTKSPSYMSEETMCGITKFLGKFNDAKSVDITWFGGEPLMAVPEMGRLYRKLRRKLKNIPFRSSIITTGFHLNEENIRALQRMKVTNMQITLDGLKDTHNKVKFTEGCDDVFSMVMSNIEKLCNIAPNIFVVIRVNITKTNINEFESLQKLVCTRFNNHVAIEPAFVINRNNNSNVENNLISYREQSQCILNFSQSDLVASSSVFPNTSINECAIRNPYSFSFDSEGYAYKCWEYIGNKKYAIGKVDKKGELNISNVVLLNRQLYGADQLEDAKCRTCPFLPICGGGCPIQRIENKFDNANNVCCTYYKGHLKEFIIEYIRKKEQLNSMLQQ